MTPRAVVALGIGQCVNWGVLYYAFAVLVFPLERELGVSTWVVAGAFSLALLVAAAVAPAIGRLGDRDGGPWVMQAGGMTAGAVLIAWSFVPGGLALYVAWAALGLCMAATLYEPAFVIVNRAYGDPSRRLRALAAVTLFGGLASTVFLPVTAFLVAAAGWRGAVRVLAVSLIVTTGATRIFAFRDLEFAGPRGPVEAPAPGVADGERVPDRFQTVAAMFALVSFAGAAFTSNLVPALGERNISPAAAAILGGSIGIMQLPGRALLMHGMLSGPSRLLAVSLLLQAAGLLGVAIAPSMASAAAGTMLFAFGAGMTTLLRPHLVQTAFGARAGGNLNGRIARQQQLARAAGPLAVAWLAGLIGYTTVFVVLAASFALVVLVSQGVPGGVQLLTHEKETV